MAIRVLVVLLFGVVRLSAAELRAVVGQPFSAVLDASSGYYFLYNLDSAPVIPESISFTGATPRPSDATLPAGLMMERVGTGVYPFTGIGIKISGTPTQAGLYQFALQNWGVSHIIHTYVGASQQTLSLFVLTDPYYEQVAAYYQNAALVNWAYPSYYYWHALRGLFLGAGVNDYSLAYFWYYSSMAGFYYQTWAWAGDLEIARQSYYLSYAYAYWYYYAFRNEWEAGLQLFYYFSALAGSSH